MRAVSKKRARELRIYGPLRRAFLEENPVCQFPWGCTAAATEIQHRRGRRGERLNDVQFWAASCHRHNQWAEEHTADAYACGWLIRVEGQDVA